VLLVDLLGSSHLAVPVELDPILLLLVFQQQELLVLLVVLVEMDLRRPSAVLAVELQEVLLVQVELVVVQQPGVLLLPVVVE